MFFDRKRDEAIRNAAFAWLAHRRDLRGTDVFPHAELKQGLKYQGQQVKLISPQGIFKPRVMELPLSITTAPKKPYDDGFDAESGLLRYRYRRAPDALNHRDNVGLRNVMQRGLPLVYLHGVVPGSYLAVWPAYVVQDDLGSRTFSIDLAKTGTNLLSAADWQDTDPALRRRYALTVVQQRLHQGAFHDRVLRAYRNQCALCRLRHAELLDAAHIVADSSPAGTPETSNGLAFCRLHHAAFDRFFIGIRPDYTIEVRPRILRERDGPTLRHAIQGLHGEEICVPRKIADRPAKVRLEERYTRFRELAEAS